MIFLLLILVRVTSHLDVLLNKLNKCKSQLFKTFPFVDMVCIPLGIMVFPSFSLTSSTIYDVVIITMVTFDFNPHIIKKFLPYTL